MEVLVLLIFVGSLVVALALGFFTWTVQSGSLQHADRLSLLPLRADEAVPPTEVAPVPRSD